MATYDTSTDLWVYETEAFFPRFGLTRMDGATVYPKAVGVSAVAAAYRKNPMGEVELKGHIKSGSVGSAAFQLPVGFWPAEDQVLDVHSEDATGTLPCTIRILADNGAVIISTGGNAFVSLDGIKFKAG